VNASPLGRFLFARLKRLLCASNVRIWGRRARRRQRRAALAVALSSFSVLAGGTGRAALAVPRMATALSPSPFTEPEPMVPFSGAGLARPPSLGGTRRTASHSELQIYWSVLAYLRVHHGAVQPHYRSKEADWELRELLVFASQLASRHSKRASAPAHVFRALTLPNAGAEWGLRSGPSCRTAPSHTRIPKMMAEPVFHSCRRARSRLRHRRDAPSTGPLHGRVGGSGTN
jgi:hypothetical protein